MINALFCDVFFDSVSVLTKSVAEMTFSLAYILNVAFVALYHVNAGAIIGDGDRKPWDPRGPMIWDNFSVFRTNCAILTSYICANPRTCRVFSRVWCHVT